MFADSYLLPYIIMGRIALKRTCQATAGIGFSRVLDEMSGSR